MEIGATYHLPVATGLEQQSARQHRPDSTGSGNEQASTHVSRPHTIPQTAHRSRPLLQAQPMFDQSLTYRGEQARRAYVETSLGGETELINRLDVRI